MIEIRMKETDMVILLIVSIFSILFSIPGIVVGFFLDMEYVIDNRLWTVLVFTSVMLLLCGIVFLLIFIYRFGNESSSYLLKTTTDIEIDKIADNFRKDVEKLNYIFHIVEAEPGFVTIYVVSKKVKRRITENES